MEFYYSMFLCLLLTGDARGQSSDEMGLLCPAITAEDLGSTMSFSTNGLVSLALSGEPGVIPVRILQYRVLCDASGTRRNTSSHVSVLVRFQCDAPTFLPECDSRELTRQYQFSCATDNTWSTFVLGSSDFVQTISPTSDFLSVPRNQCQLCVDPDQDITADPMTHCVGECSQLFYTSPHLVRLILGNFVCRMQSISLQ